MGLRLLQGERKICGSELGNALVKKEHRDVPGRQSQGVGCRTRDGWRDKSGLEGQIRDSGFCLRAPRRALGLVKKESDHIGWAWEGVFSGCPAEGQEVPPGRDHSSRAPGHPALGQCSVCKYWPLRVIDLQMPPVVCGLWSSELRTLHVICSKLCCFWKGFPLSL